MLPLAMPLSLLLLQTPLPPAVPPTPQAMSAADENFNLALKQVLAHQIPEIPVGVTTIQEATLPVYEEGKPAAKSLSAGRGKKTVDDSADTNRRCLRQLILPLAPQETVVITFQVSHPAKFSFALGVPLDPKLPLADQIRVFNKLPAALRVKGVTLKNPSDAPTEALLAIQGFENYPYLLKIERKRG
jgi:hypothetical protein